MEIFTNRMENRKGRISGVDDKAEELKHFIKNINKLKTM